MNLRTFLKKHGIVLLATGVIAAALIVIGCRYLSPTRIALVNFPAFQSAKMIKSSDNGFIRLYTVETENLKKIRRADAVLVFGMGIRFSDADRELTRKVMRKKPLHVYLATDPQNRISNLDSLQRETLESYLQNGGKQNYRSLFSYIRAEICGKKAFAGEVLPAYRTPSDALFHIEEDVWFTTVAEYEKYLDKKGLLKPNAPKIALVAGFAGPSDANAAHWGRLIEAFQEKGFTVYPLAGFSQRLAFLKEIEPDAVVYMPHGRLAQGMADSAVRWLKTRNIPMFCPTTLNTLYEDWMNDKQGMAGGFMSQSIVMPEIDGGIVTQALVALFTDEEGLYRFDIIPGRLEQFTRTVKNYIDLRTKPDSEKKIAVYYYKGPGTAAFTAAGLEVIPSLYNLLLNLRASGYKVDNLPSGIDAFEEELSKGGAVYNEYAEGSIRNYLENGNPAWIAGKDFKEMLLRRFPTSCLKALEERYGEAPGSFYVKDGNIAVTRLQYGNVVLLPQPVQGIGSNSFEAVHGENPVPPYHYIASYLYVRDVFHADALLHFGTHGSLEFIPGKLSALSMEDWSDRLIDDLPHFYLYTTADVGEAVIAKRRSYADLISHLNVPLSESGLGKELSGLLEDIRKNLQSENPDNARLREIKKRIVEKGLHRDLRLDSNLNQTYTEEELQKVCDFAEELCTEKITAGLYTLGKPFAPELAASSARLMGETEGREQQARYLEYLNRCPQEEMRALLNALDGGFIAPSPGGDFVANPNVLPTGRNLYSINPENTPSVAAWEKGVKLGDELIADYRKKHGGEYPRKVSFTLWSGSFIESEGATLAEILYLLGVEPVRDRMNRILDIRVLNPEELQRPYIDVVVQTSGQFRDLAASRLELVQRAVGLVAKVNSESNYVAQGLIRAEKVLLEKGYPPEDARRLSAMRIFGGLNGMAGTGITAMAESGDRWEEDSEMAKVYLNNMGAVYGESKNWGDFKPGVFEAALQNTDAVVQPRQSNTWGALSLDHVYEFMGGLTMTVRNVTGHNPEGYFNDLRNRNRARTQDLQTAIGVETRTKLFNPVYIGGMMRGGASSAGELENLIRNTYGWNVMNPEVIDNTVWNRIYETYVEDRMNLGIREFFERESPAALQEMTAVMLETARKGYWQASEEQLKRTAELHAETVMKYDACCNGFTCNNAKLRDFISERTSNPAAYRNKIAQTRQIGSGGEVQGIVLEKENRTSISDEGRPAPKARHLAFILSVLLLFVLAVFFIRKRRRNG